MGAARRGAPRPGGYSLACAPGRGPARRPGWRGHPSALRPLSQGCFQGAQGTQGPHAWPQPEVPKPTPCAAPLSLARATPRGSRLSCGGDPAPTPRPTLLTPPRDWPRRAAPRVTCKQPKPRPHFPPARRTPAASTVARPQPAACRGRAAHAPPPAAPPAPRAAPRRAAPRLPTRPGLPLAPRPGPPLRYHWISTPSLTYRSLAPFSSLVTGQATSRWGTLVGGKGGAGLHGLR